MLKRWLLLWIPVFRAYSLWDGGILDWSKVKRITAELNVSRIALYCIVFICLHIKYSTKILLLQCKIVIYKTSLVSMESLLDRDIL